MIEINLLPSELRPKKKLPIDFDISNIFQAKLVVVILVGIVLLHLLLHAAGVLSNRRLVGLQAQWSQMTSKNQEIQKLQNELAAVNKKIPMIEQLMEKRILWAEKLNRVSDLLVSGVWLDEFSIREEVVESRGRTEITTKYLLISGSAASRTQDEPALIGIFMQNLKDDPAFAKDFKEIELGPIRKRLIEQTEVMDFTLICRFKEDRLTALEK
ncbi:MAG: hypothetical protein JW869_04530 [Candidatus Omnitrophica bacterium]|nr:hypothetical protein [Candidatus Omnitrophota bacterium]